MSLNSGEGVSTLPKSKEITKLGCVGLSLSGGTILFPSKA